MKTVEEIKAWVFAKNWFPRFHSRVPAAIARADSSLISGAFDWSQSPEGHSFWQRINADYIVWYMSR